MNEPAAVEPLIWRAARKYRACGLFPLPIKPGQKSPLLDGWQEIEDFDLDVFMRPGVNVGLRMGPQPDGRNLYAIDIDPKHGGYEAWAELTEGLALPETAFHMTPSGGQHIFYEAPADLDVVNKKLALGIDTRGPRGQVVAPPSQIPSGHYTFENAIHQFEVAPMPLRIIEALRRPDPVVDRPTPTLVAGGDGGVVEWVRRHLTWDSYLGKHGFGIASQHGNDLYVVRPGKTDPGHSGVAHFEGALVLFTTEVPSELAPFMRPTKDNSGVSCSLFAFIAAYEHGGDMSAAGRFIRERYMGWSPPSVRVNGSVPAPAVTRLDGADGAYWEACARNERVFQAARAEMISPDALDVAIFAMQSCLVPPGFMVESPVGPQPLNMLSCLIARTGDFKSSTLEVAQRLMGPFPPWVSAMGMGSGEGIGAMFLKEEIEDDGKRKVKTGRLVRNDVKAVFFEADEGSGLTQQAGRQGATVIANLCKAWSGSMLGEANADIGRRRQVLHNDYRIGALVNIQPSNFHGLFSEANTSTGLTGRFLYSGTVDPSIPDVEPPWPGPFEWEQLPQEPLLITLDPEILAAAKAEVRRRHRTSGLDGGTDAVGQAPATLTRMAALLALTDGRRHVTMDDWRIASLRGDASAQAHKTMSVWAQQQESDRRHKMDQAKAASEESQADEAERIRMGKAADRILTVLAAGPMSPGNVSAKMTERQRDYRDPAYQHLAAMGKVKEVDGRWALTL